MVQKRSSTTVRKKQIIDAARKLITRYGSEHVTVRRIAKETGISEGAIYKHFKSKRDVLSLLIDDVEKALLSEEGFVLTEDCRTQEALENAFINHMSHIIERRGISFQVIAEIVSFGDSKLNKKAYEVIDGYTTMIAEMLRRGVDSGTVRADVDLDAAAGLFFCLTQGLVNTWTLSQYGFDLREKYNSLWGVFRNVVLQHPR
ncbi:MAG: TetR/AcrR family transcriptional regulator [Dehalococcoidales bacterium]|nr:TetR/AcrR family transcriptional regulator [Dehalococcoidales bacterium]